MKDMEIIENLTVTITVPFTFVTTHTYEAETLEGISFLTPGYTSDEWYVKDSDGSSFYRGRIYVSNGVIYGDASWISRDFLSVSVIDAWSSLAQSEIVRFRDTSWAGGWQRVG